VEVGQVGANAGQIVNVSTGILSEAHVGAIEGGTGIRLQGQGTADNVDIFVHGITVYRPGEIVPPEIPGNPGTLDRTGLDVRLGAAGMAALIEAGHFGSRGAATMVTEDDYVFVHGIANNSSGMRILPPDAITMTSGFRYLLRATGRTTGTIASSRLELAHLEAGAGVGLGNEAVTPGSPNTIPASFTFTRELTSENVAAGLRIAPNGWGWITEDGAPTPAEQFIARFADFAFSIDDLIIFREEIIVSYQEIDFNLAGDVGFQALADRQTFGGWTAVGTPRITVDGAMGVTIHVHEGRRFMYHGNRTANHHGINVVGAPVGNTIRITGRTGANWVPGGGAMEVSGTDVPQTGNLAAGAQFTLMGTVSGAEVRITGNSWTGGTPGAQSFYIYSIIVGTDLDQPAAPSYDRVDYVAVENFWPAPVDPPDPSEEVFSLADWLEGRTGEITGDLPAPFTRAGDIVTTVVDDGLQIELDDGWNGLDFLFNFQEGDVLTVGARVASGQLFLKVQQGGDWDDQRIGTLVGLHPGGASSVIPITADVLAAIQGSSFGGAIRIRLNNPSDDNTFVITEITVSRTAGDGP